MAFTTHLSSPNISINAAVQAFADPVAAAARSDKLEDNLWKSWKALLDLAASTPHASQSTLLEFIGALKMADTPKKDNGDLYDIWDRKFQWKDFPLLGAETREQWNAKPEASSSQEDQQSWVNRNAFLAQLTCVSEFNAPLDFSLYAVWALRESFEDLDLNTDLPPDFILETAAVWLLYAGQKLKKGSEIVREYDGRTAREGNALGEKGWKGLNKERWGIWTSSLMLAESKVNNENTKLLLREASKNV